MELNFNDSDKLRLLQMFEQKKRQEDKSQLRDEYGRQREPRELLMHRLLEVLVLCRTPNPDYESDREKLLERGAALYHQDRAFHATTQAQLHAVFEELEPFLEDYRLRVLEGAMKLACCACRKGLATISLFIHPKNSIYVLCGECRENQP